MHRASGYDPVLSSKASSILVGLPKPKQKKILSLLFQIAERPSQLGDYVTKEENGGEIQHLMVGDWHFSFWADDAVRELRITDFTEL